MHIQIYFKLFYNISGSRNVCFYAVICVKASQYYFGETSVTLATEKLGCCNSVMVLYW